MTDEQTYILQMKNGSQKAFDILYKMYVRRLYGFCYQYTKSQEDTEEVVQDVFLKLWTYRETLQAEDTLQHWLFASAKNRLINLYRARVNSPHYEEYIHFCDTVRLSVTDTAHKIEYDDFCRELERAKRHLSDTQRKIFTLSFEKQIPYKEIALQLLLNENTVKNQVSLAMKILRKQLSKCLYLLICLSLR